MEKKQTRKVKVGGCYIGGDVPVSIQSVTNTDIRDIEATLEQINILYKIGCKIIRCAVPDMKATEALRGICKDSPIPVVADIHFDYKLALAAIENGVPALRTNPGNTGSMEKVKIVAEVARAKNLPIRIGVNSGSLEGDTLERDGEPTAKGLVGSALRHAEILEELDFYDIVTSIKPSDVVMMIEAYRLMSESCNYPLHLRVTESGTPFRGTIKSGIGLGTLLTEGIGDAVRVSLTSNPTEEIKVAKEILKALKLRESGLQFISCPIYDRTQIDLIKIAQEAEKKSESINKNIKVAVMECAVNGSEGIREADIGIAGGRGEGLIFKKGIIAKKVKKEDLIEELMKEIENM